MKKIKSLFSLLLTMTFALAVSAVAGASITVPICYVTDHMKDIPQVTSLLTIGIYSYACMSDHKFTFKNMAYSAPFVFTEGICPDIQVTLAELMGPNAPEKKRTPVGYLQAVTSDTNRAGLNVIPIDSQNGKKHNVQVTYAQRGISTDIQYTDNNACTAEISKVPYEDIITIEDVISTKGITFSEDQMRRLCEADKTWIARIIAAELDILSVSLDKMLITKQLANFGNFHDGTKTVHSRQLLNVIAANNKVPNYYGEAQIMNDFADINFTGRPILIGNGKLREYVRLADVGCCNANGIDNGQAGNFDYYDDRYVAGVTGNADNFIALAPGNVQLLTYNKYKDSYRKNNDSFIKTTMVDPATGIEYDMIWQYDSCEEQWVLVIKLYYNMFFLPSNAFNAADELSGVNYSQFYRATEA